MGSFKLTCRRRENGRQLLKSLAFLNLLKKVGHAVWVKLFPRLESKTFGNDAPVGADGSEPVVAASVAEAAVLLVRFVVVLSEPESSPLLPRRS